MFWKSSTQLKQSTEDFFRSKKIWTETNWPKDTTQVDVFFIRADCCYFFQPCQDARFIFRLPRLQTVKFRFSWQKFGLFWLSRPSNKIVRLDSIHFIYVTTFSTKVRYVLILSTFLTKIFWKILIRPPIVMFWFSLSKMGMFWFSRLSRPAFSKNCLIDPAWINFRVLQKGYDLTVSTSKICFKRRDQLWDG